MKMKITPLKSNCLATVLAMLCTQLVSAPTSSAADLFPVTVNATGVSTNQDGNLTCRQFNNWTIINAVAEAQGITNLTDLSVMYDLQADAIEVVSGTNNTVLGTPLSFADGVSLSNTNDTQVQRLSNVYWQTNQAACGTLLAGESIRYGSTNQITGFSFAGQLQFAVLDNGTNGPTIYYGLIRTSRPGTCVPSKHHRQYRPGQAEDDNGSD
jgi:hypothetical protein